MEFHAQYEKAAQKPPAADSGGRQSKKSLFIVLLMACEALDRVGIFYRSPELKQLSALKYVWLICCSQTELSEKGAEAKDDHCLRAVAAYSTKTSLRSLDFARPGYSVE